MCGCRFAVEHFAEDVVAATAAAGAVCVSCGLQLLWPPIVMITADGDLTMRHPLVQLDLKEVRLATALSEKLQCLLRAGGPIPSPILLVHKTQAADLLSS